MKATVRRFLAVAGKEMGDLLRERTLVTLLVIQLFIAAFSAFLMTGLSGLYDPESLQGFPPAEVAYVGDGGFDRYLRGAENIGVNPMGLEAALAEFETGRVAAVVQEGPGRLDDQRRVSLLMPDGEFQTSLLVNQFKSLLRDYERDLRVERQDRLDQDILIVEGDFEPENDVVFAYTILVPLLVLTPAFLAGGIVTDSLVQELQTRTFHLLQASPMRPGTILAAKLSVAVGLVPLQVILWLSLIGLNGLTIQNPGWILFLATATAVLMSGLGLLVAFVVRQEAPAQALYALGAIALAGGSVFLPRDPLNLVARLATGAWASSEQATLLLVGAFALFSLTVALLESGRRLAKEAV